MATMKDLERRVEELEKKLEKTDNSWVMDLETCKEAAHKLNKAFDWEECPYEPADFRSWDDLYDWLDKIGDK